MICTSEGYQDLPIGFCQMLNLIYLGMLMFYSGKPIENPLGKIIKSEPNSILISIHFIVLGKNKSSPGLLAITRYHGVEEAPCYVEMDLTGLSELPKFSRASGINQKLAF